MISPTQDKVILHDDTLFHNYGDNPRLQEALLQPFGPICANTKGPETIEYNFLKNVWRHLHWIHIQPKSSTKFPMTVKKEEYCDKIVHHLPN